MVIEAFGGVLQQQGAGFYVTLELMALVWGSMALDSPPLPPVTSEPMRFKRRTHDFARRLMTDSGRLSKDEISQVGAGNTEETLRALLKALTVQTPGRKSRDNWRTSHFLPYVGDLVHYEAVMRGESSDPGIWRRLPGKEPSIEQNLYRGGGSLAHRILREDPDEARIESTRVGLGSLLESSSSALGRVAEALQAKDRVSPDESQALNEFRARVHDTRWVENLRAGTNRIVTNPDVTRPRKVDALLYWVPFCVAMHQLDRAHIVLNDAPHPGVVAFCADKKSPVKALATEQVKGAVHSVYECLTQTARRLGPEFLNTATWRKSPRGFFSTTLANTGFFNARTGQRHFTFGPELLEALIIANVDGEMEFEEFCGTVLRERLGIIVDARSAESRALLRAADRSAFDRNADGFLQSAADLGMVREFSDATRMIGPRMS